MKRICFILAILVLPKLTLLGESEPSAPPLNVIIQRALERAAREDENDRQFDHLYQYKHVRLTEFLDSKGDLRSEEEKVTEDGARPHPARQPQATTPKTENQDGPVTETHSNIRGKALKVKDYSLADLVRRFQFTLAGSDTVNGRPAWVLDFRPASGKLPVHDFKDNFINKAAGRVWVDEGDYAIAKADLHLTKQVDVLGGLVGAVWKFTYSFDRTRTAEGLWYARHVDWHLEGREVVFNRVVDYHEQKLDLEKVSEPAR